VYILDKRRYTANTTYLKDIDIFLQQAKLLQHLGYSHDWADAHVTGFHSCHGKVL